VLDAFTDETTWELNILLQGEQGLSGKNDVWWKSNAPCYKLSSGQVPNLVMRHVMHEVACGFARWRLDHFVFVNKQNSQVESRNHHNSSTYFLSSRLHLLSHFLLYYTHWQYPDFDIMWLAQNNTSYSITHPITNTTLYLPHPHKVEKVLWAFWAFWRFLKVKFTFSWFCRVQLYELYSVILHLQIDGICKLGIVFQNRYSLVGYIS
jgi:hypothetical protein